MFTDGLLRVASHVRSLVQLFNFKNLQVFEHGNTFKELVSILYFWKLRNKYLLLFMKYSYILLMIYVFPGYTSRSRCTM